jgi:hypothetical protein
MVLPISQLPFRSTFQLTPQESPGITHTKATTAFAFSSHSLLLISIAPYHDHFINTHLTAA